MCLDSHMQWVNKEFGRLLASTREQANLSQAQLAKRMELSRASIINMERGRQNITLVALYKLADLLEVNPADLLPIKPESLITSTDEIPEELDRLIGGKDG